MCRFEALGRGVCNLPLAEDKLFDINGVTNVGDHVPELVG